MEVELIQRLIKSTITKRIETYLYYNSELEFEIAVKTFLQLSGDYLIINADIDNMEDIIKGKKFTYMLSNDESIVLILEESLETVDSFLGDTVFDDLAKSHREDNKVKSIKDFRK